MPTYTYACKNGHAFERYLPVAQYLDPQTCDCGAASDKVITAPMIFIAPDIHYRSPIDDRPITSKAARMEDLARSNCQPYDPEMKTDYLRRNERSQASLETSMDATVDREIALMPARKREKLQAELEGGMMAEPVRVTPAAKTVSVEIAR